MCGSCGRRGRGGAGWARMRCDANEDEEVDGSISSKKAGSLGWERDTCCRHVPRRISRRRVDVRHQLAALDNREGPSLSMPSRQQAAMKRKRLRELQRGSVRATLGSMLDICLAYLGGSGFAKRSCERTRDSWSVAGGSFTGSANKPTKSDRDVASSFSRCGCPRTERRTCCSRL